MPEILSPPPTGSDLAGKVDELFLFTLAVAVAFSGLIAVLILYFGVRYRRRGAGDVGVLVRGGRWLEIAWSVIPLVILLTMFGWGAKLYFEVSRPPEDAEEYFVIGRRWMWKIQHPDGPREIDELHAPVGRAIKLTMTSEDVIHSFYLPAFRIKWDVLPGRYTTAWFRATTPGTYHLFCAEYCGTSHSAMVGRVVIMEPESYEAWLATMRSSSPALPAASGEDAFRTRGCGTCHVRDSAARAPILQDLWGREVTLASGETVRADAEYIRESILRPAVKVVRGYSPVMPAYEGQISEEEVLQLITYIRSLSTGAALDGGAEDAAGAPDGGSLRDAAGVPDGAVPLGEETERSGGQR